MPFPYLPLISSLLLSSTLSIYTSAQTTTTTTTCNGHSEFCTRSYSNITFLGAHDSPFVGPFPSQNQNLQVPEQLDFGIRFLQGQTHTSPETGALQLCHTSCLLEDAGTLQSFLATVKTWLDGHPNEVVTLLLTNGDSRSVSTFDEAFTNSGIKKYAFIPRKNPLGIADWPTLGELIDAGTTLVVFLDYGANNSMAPYILDEFQYFFENPYDVTDPTFPDCSINRPPGAKADGRMYIVNHFLDVDILGVLIPDRVNAPKTNAAVGTGSIGAQSHLCNSIYHRLPNVVLVDFADQGSVIQAQNILNRV